MSRCGVVGLLRRAPGRSRRAWAGAALCVFVGGACEDAPTATIGDIVCDLDGDLLYSVLARDAIPALTEPAMVQPDDPGADYLVDSDRVLGITMNGEARAYPHNVLWHHEIVNDRIGDGWVSVTFCPLTGSGLAFDSELGAGRLTLGVSGLLYANNLVMFDRLTEQVYGPQLAVSGSCGGFRGRSLELVPVQEMSWGRWRALHPNTTVVTSQLGHGRNYRQYPYGTYDQITSNELLWPMPADRSRPIKERVLAVRDGAAGRGYPYGELAELGDVAAVNEPVAGVPTVIFYEASNGQTALAFDARVDGQVLTFDADPAGHWTDRETGSVWGIDGTATAGPHTGRRLSTRADAYTLFWFAWRHFQPDGSMFTAG